MRRDELLLTERVLHLLPPEFAHKLTILGLRSVPLPSVKVPQNHQCQIFDQIFRNCVGLAAGADKTGAALAGWDRLGFGFVEVGTVTPYARTGNPRPRLWRLTQSQSVINWMGLPSPGPDIVAGNITRYRQRKKKADGEACMRIGVSVASPEGNLDHFKSLAEQFAPLADYIVLNASCPNTDEDHAPAQQLSRQVKAVVAEAKHIPVMVKLGPTLDKDVLEPMAGAAMEAGACGMIATNTVPFDKKTLLREVDFTWPRHEGEEVGGYSGPRLLSTSAWMVSHLRDTLGADVPVMGVGGIQSPDDVHMLLRAGANAVQLYTGLIYKGPRLVRDILYADMAV